MSCYAYAMVTTPQKTIAFLSIAGAMTAVKAIWASVISRKSPLHVSGNYRKWTGDSDVDYVVVKQSLDQGLHHWVLYPDPATSPYLLLLPMNGTTPQDQLVEVLNRHTLWPVKAEWADALWEKGIEGKKDEQLVRKLDVYGTGIAWAYAVNPDGWDEVIDQLAKDGLLFRSTEGGTSNG